MNNNLVQFGNIKVQSNLFSYLWFLFFFFIWHIFSQIILCCVNNEKRILLFIIYYLLFINEQRIIYRSIYCSDKCTLFRYVIIFIFIHFFIRFIKVNIYSIVLLKFILFLFSLLNWIITSINQISKLFFQILVYCFNYKLIWVARIS